MFDDFVSVDSTPLYTSSSGSTKIIHLLWGDGVRFVGSSTTNGRRKVKTRGGITGWATVSSLGGESLLEFYFIDVGQGDGVLIKTPDFRHVMIDGGYPRNRQDTGKNAADFVDWKFFKLVDIVIQRFTLRSSIAVTAGCAFVALTARHPQVQ